jgi:RNA polymerase sigma-B factor
MTGRVATEQEAQEGSFYEFARTRDPALRDELIAANLDLARQLARRFANRGEPQDDLVQVASLALVKAVDRFDPDRGVAFSSFAVTSIVGELKRHFRDRGWAVRAPRRIQELYLELGHHIEQLSQELGRAPNVVELAKASNSSVDAVLEALEAGRGYRTSSLDAPDRDDQTLAESLGSDDPQFIHVDDRSVLARALQGLSERDQFILRLRFVDGLTQSEIAARLKVSQMQISRLLAASLQSLREAFAEQGPSEE